MPAHVRDARYPTQHGVLERQSRTTVVVPAAATATALGDVGSRRSLLVKEEDFTQDLRGYATGRGERVAPCTDRAKRTTDGGHLAIDEVERCSVTEEGGRDLSYQVVDESHASLDGVVPVLGGPGQGGDVEAVDMVLSDV